MNDSPPPRRRRVMVVDDAQPIFELFRGALEELEYEPVTTVACSIDADRIRAAAPDAVILDLEVGTQASYGVDIARQLREDSSFNSISIMVCTANAEALDGERQVSRDIGVPIRLKPFTVEAIGGVLEDTRARLHDR